MLVLARHQNEKIVVSDKDDTPVLVVEIAEIRGDKVKVGLTADSKWNIDREEVWKAKIQKKLDQPTNAT